MTHELAFERLPDLLVDRDDPDLLAHVGSCHRCQRQLFLLARVDRLLRQRRPRARRLGPVFAALAFAAAIVAVLMLPQRHVPSPVQFALKTEDGAIVARAQLERGDAENESIAFVADGLPSRLTDTYLLWTQGPNDSRPVVVGRFMVSHRGACRARFNVAGSRPPSHFWITPSTEPAAIVAST